MKMCHPVVDQCTEFSQTILKFPHLLFRGLVKKLSFYQVTFSTVKGKLCFFTVHSNSDTLEEF